MYKAICAQCGNECDVPFKPTGIKPVYCDACFASRGGHTHNRNDNRDYGASRSRTTFPALCDNCGEPFELPFKPTQNRPVYCPKCFADDDIRGGGISKDQMQELIHQFDALNYKLDKIMKALSLTTSHEENGLSQEDEKVNNEGEIKVGADMDNPDTSEASDLAESLMEA